MNSLDNLQDKLSLELMAELSNHTGAVSLPRLGKRLGVRQSSLLRCIAYLGEQSMGQHQGAGWVRLEQDGERSMLSLTEAGRQVCKEMKAPADQDAAVSTGVIQHQVQRVSFHGQASIAVLDQVAEEVPVALVYNGISHAAMLATPLNLEDFALGFSLSEAIVDDPSEIYEIECISSADVHGIEVQMRISAARFAALKERRRSLAGNTGCGLCGKESLQALPMQLPVIKSALVEQLSPASLYKAMQALNAQQVINSQTGAVHAAAWVDMQGLILALREDVGRHNALDKLLGTLASARVIHKASEPGFLLMSSRISYELVQKAARANIAILAALSAPTSLAIDLAVQAGICLTGFVREHGFVVYSHPERLQAE
ncbi:formate dehydrogenase accessory sulfurtransferase FdhD [Undibacterium pigrum]|uniref:Sulfur carrier protein FdhD n=1 Tax=Undibacterium pigrum TaxID=401470 RepID=A0A318JIQ3_9BURK|nr:formate dehydrogenase accessory sulfurtransferase FdhD [Undibacterium pigrum]PXX47213.1 formate dehydrogenase accessory protein FdhD [Undibacterium pigrum]